MYKIILIVSILAITGVVYFSLNQQAEPENLFPDFFLCENQPCNVILIIPETLSARHMGIYGYDRDTTPFIDEFFGKEGVVFENAWSAAPWTLPSFAALFTSQLPSDVFVEGVGDKLCSTIQTFIDVLTENKTPKFAAHTWTFYPSWDFFPQKNKSFVNLFEQDELFQEEDPFLFLKSIKWIEKNIQKEDKQPFFLLLQPLASHDPYDPPDPYRYFFDAPPEYPGPVDIEMIWEARRAMAKGEDIESELERFRLQYDQEIRHLDSQLESFIFQIPEEILRNTVFIFTSDHGEPLGQHNTIAHGLTIYEEAIHVPFLIRAPGVNPARIYQPITLLDAGPTILDIFNFNIPDTFQGISLLPLLQGEDLQLEERIIIAEWHRRFLDPKEAETIKPEVRTEPLPGLQQRAARKQEWKLIQNADDSFELYNLEQDYYEQDNLIARWRDLPKKEQEVVISLFKALNISSPLQ